MKDANELMQEVLTADRLKLEDEIEDMEEEIAIIENLFIALLYVVCNISNPDVLCRCRDNEQLLHRRKKKLTDKLERKRKELEFIMKRLEEYS